MHFSCITNIRRGHQLWTREFHLSSVDSPWEFFDDVLEDMKNVIFGPKTLDGDMISICNGALQLPSIKESLHYNLDKTHV